MTSKVSLHAENWMHGVQNLIWHIHHTACLFEKNSNDLKVQMTCSYKMMTCWFPSSVLVIVVGCFCENICMRHQLQFEAQKTKQTSYDTKWTHMNDTWTWQIVCQTFSVAHVTSDFTGALVLLHAIHDLFMLHSDLNTTNFVCNQTWITATTCTPLYPFLCLLCWLVCLYAQFLSGCCLGLFMLNFFWNATPLHFLVSDKCWKGGDRWERIIEQHFWNLIGV